MSRKEPLGHVLITQEQILKRAEEIGAQITGDYDGESIILVGILRGAVLWMSDIMKNIDLDVEIDFMACSSYGAATKSTGEVKIIKDLNSDIEGKNVILVEDIIDSGLTLNYLKGYLENRKPRSLKICSLLDKPAGRKVEIIPDYVGFVTENKFIVGYGLDFDQKYRHLPYITFINE